MPDGAPWLRAMENGGLGEARARAFLMERFWVLERSVDVEGADYLIQQRLTATNFLDREPPRLGVVQVKFIQDGNTYIKVQKDYVTDRHGSPYGEFFLIVFTGREDDQRSFLLSSRDMLSEFEEIDDDGKAVLRLRGDKLIGRSNYEITQRKHALDRIEHALKNADFLANRRFIGGTRYVKLTRDQIDHDLTVSLDNGWVDIPKQFFKGKQKLQSTLFEMEQIAEALSKILRATDPMEALRIYEEDIADCVGRGGLGDEIAVRFDFFDEDFFNAVKNHRARLAKLKELGLEGNYFKLIETFNTAVLEKVLKLACGPKLQAVEISVTYDEKTLRDVVIHVTPASIEGHEPQVITSEKGAQTVIVRIPAQMHLTHERHMSWKQVHEIDTDERKVFLKEQLWQLRRPFQGALDKIYLGEDLSAW
jgi:hypothetical protein